jgi:hypothetical protein
MFGIADKETCHVESDHSRHERPSQPTFLKARSIQVGGSRSVKHEQAAKIGRNPGLSRTRVRAKARVTPPRMHQCRQMQRPAEVTFCKVELTGFEPATP